MAGQRWDDDYSDVLEDRIAASEQLGLRRLEQDYDRYLDRLGEGER